MKRIPLRIIQAGLHKRNFFVYFLQSKLQHKKGKFAKRSKQQRFIDEFILVCGRELRLVLVTLLLNC